MRYVSGVHALNLPCDLNTCGDWHTSALRWEKLTLEESDRLPFGDYGIEANRQIPEHKEKFAVANHIRALLDLIYNGRFDIASGMKNNYICNDGYTKEIFDQVYKLRTNSNWEEIYDFLHKEYGRQWRLWVTGKRHTEK